jgi:hypothetical protein
MDSVDGCFKIEMSNNEVDNDDIKVAENFWCTKILPKMTECKFD